MTKKSSGNIYLPQRRTLWNELRPKKIRFLRAVARSDLLFFGFQEVEAMRWPTMLEETVFGNAFDREIERTVFPTGLRRMVFGARFNRTVERVAWPAGLEEVRP